MLHGSLCRAAETNPHHCRPRSRGLAVPQVPSPRNQALYNEYKALADQETARHRVHFVGRLASYKYFNMDEALAAALLLFAQLEPLGGAQDSAGGGNV